MTPTTNPSSSTVTVTMSNVVLAASGSSLETNGVALISLTKLAETQALTLTNIL